MSLLKTALLSQKIREEIEQEGSIIEGKGMVDNETKKLIFLTVENRKIPYLRDIIQENDAEAFMVVMEASELLGRGH